MMRCSNENCTKDPLESLWYIVVSIDGDSVCDEQCRKEYEKQKEYFLNVTVQSEKLTTEYLTGKREK
jgi:hypothetical protein